MSTSSTTWRPAGAAARSQLTGADPAAAGAVTRGQNGFRSSAGSTGTGGTEAGAGTVGSVTPLRGTDGATGVDAVPPSPPAKSRNTRRATMTGAPTTPIMAA